MPESFRKVAAVEDESPTEELRQQFEAMRYTPPVAKRYLVNDTTVEKLGELLNHHPNGLLLFRDELSGWLHTMDRPGHENDRAFYCEAWNGTSGYTYDRIGRGTLHIRAACLSVLGGIQPGPLERYLRAVFGGRGDDGLLQRFQLAVWPDGAGPGRNASRRVVRAWGQGRWTIREALPAVSPWQMRKSRLTGRVCGQP